MHLPHSLTVLVSLAAAAAAQADVKAQALKSCLDQAGVRSIVQSDTAWDTATLQFQKRLTAQPASIAYPSSRDDIAASLACARNASVKVSALGAAHSFVGYGFGEPGNLIVNMAAFNSASFDNRTQQLTFGGGTHVGPVLKYLWDGYGRHFPHVRGAHVGLVGSSIGGGYGTTSRQHGIPMDLITSVEYMLYNGTIVKAGQGSDLLFAAQGAGASYGIILSMTTKTIKPAYPTAISYTISLGNATSEAGARALVAIQDFATAKSTPDSFSLRWTLSAPPFSGAGFYYGNPSKFNTTFAPLLTQLRQIHPSTTLTSTQLPFWDSELAAAGAGMALPEGGSLGGRSFYTQALTITTDKPLTLPLIQTLYANTFMAFNRTDLSKSGFLDLWGGVSDKVKDSDTAYAHGKNLWLIRWEASASGAGAWPVDGISYLKGQMLPFEAALTKAKVPLRGFANYRDEALKESEWSERLYGEKNYKRLKKIKAVYDPEGLFSSNKQSIPAQKN